METALKKRIARLIENPFGAMDIKDVLLTLRDPKYNGGSILRETGDFIAHAQERRKGLITEVARGNFAILNFFPRYREGSAVDMSVLPTIFPITMRTVLHRLSPKRLKIRTGLDHQSASARLETLLDRLVSSGSHLTLTYMSRDEQILLNALLTDYRIDVAFSDEQLFKEFKRTIIANKLIPKDHTAEIKRLKTPLILCALAAMHLCEVKLADGSTVTLELDRGAGEPMNMKMRFPWPGSSLSVFIAVPVFTTNFYADAHCSDNIRTASGDLGPVEFAADGKLHLL